MPDVRRRELIALLGGAAVAWPIAARAQGDRTRHVGVLMTTAEDDPDTQARHAAFVQGLEQLSWTDGRNLRIDARWGGGNPDETRADGLETSRASPGGESPLPASPPAAHALQAATRRHRRAGLTTRAVLDQAWAPPRNPLCQLTARQGCPEGT